MLVELEPVYIKSKAKMYGSKLEKYIFTCILKNDIMIHMQLENIYTQNQKLSYNDTFKKWDHNHIYMYTLDKDVGSFFPPIR